MGATVVETDLNYKASPTKIKDEFAEAQANDLIEYGRDPYNGSFTTVESVKIVDQTFSNRTEAFEFCLANARKWDYVVSVYYTTKDGRIFTLIAGWAAT